MELGNFKVQGLAEVLPRLSDSDQRFARDLLDSYRRRGDLSDKQWDWVIKLTQRATEPLPPAVVESVGDFTGVISLFRKAKQHLKFPKITLRVGHQPLQLSLAGERSKYEGQVQVTDGRGYGNNVWFGRVDHDGNWTQSRSVTAQEVDAVGQFLRAFSQDPAAVAKQHGGRLRPHVREELRPGSRVEVSHLRPDRRSVAENHLGKYALHSAGRHLKFTYPVSANWPDLPLTRNPHRSP
jgi:hypothetical protein